MSDDLARPYDPFEIVPRYVWVECPLGEYPGFAINVRSNLRNRDRKVLLELISDVDAERKRLADAAGKRLQEMGDSKRTDEVVALVEEMSRLQDANSARIPAAIAKYVVAWNLQERDTETDERVDLSPPSEIGVDAFENIEQPMLEWIVGTIITAYRSGKTLTDSSKTRGGSGEPSSASSETTPSDEPPASHSESDPTSAESSDTPSASTSTG